MAQPYVIQILVTAGDPDGVRVVEKSNWTGRGIVFARSDLPVASEQGLASPGVYVLLGDDPDGDFDTQVYVGQAEDVNVRLKQHVQDDGKDWWRTTIVFQSGNQSLNRAHISFLESELVRLAKEARRSKAANGNQPGTPHMAAADHAVASGFLAEMRAIFPVLGVDAFDVAVAQSPDVARRYFLTGPDASGEGEERSDGFFVFAGAKARLEEVQSIGDTYARLRRRLIETSDLVADGSSYRLTNDTLFASPSAAAAVLLGRTANGRIEWLDAEGVSLKQRQLAATGQL